ncbi:unnamed protein product [marine sediment metagenome]|uniref:Uncharacterized protein n=1 Tax=marine sediment metagenome TaxID=412755 RepID=X1Q559_9ZZZZ
MRITRSPTRLTSLLTVDHDLDFLDTYQVASLAEPAADEALRKGNADITMAELAAAIKNLAGGIAVLDASADVPLAQIPNTLTGKDAATVGGEAVADLESTMDTKIGTHAALLTYHSIKRKAADQAINNDETLTNDDDLVLAVGANEVWFIIVFMRMTSAVSATPQVDYAWAVPAGGSVVGRESFDYATYTDFDDMTTERNSPVGVTADKGNCFVMQYVGGGTAGNLQLTWAQHIATAEDTKMLANSFMICFRLA